MDERPAERGIVAVVVTYRSSAEVAACVSALRSELIGPRDAIVAVDNASGDRTSEVARAAGARVIALPRNLGFGAACNRGAAEEPGRDVLLVNPDAIVQPGAVAALRDSLHQDARRGAAGPRIERADGGPEPGCRRTFPRPGVALPRLLRLDRLMPGRFGAYNRLDADPWVPGVIDSGSGAGLLVRREAWDEIGGFDETFFMYGEDLDLCYRLHLRGWRVWYEPGARFVHRKAASTRQVPFRMLYHFHRAMWVYYRKHHARGMARLLAPAVLAGVSARFAALAVGKAVSIGVKRVA